MKKELEALKRSAPEAPRRTERPIPERFKVSRDGTDVSIRWRWLRAEHIVMALFTAVWDGFLIVYYSRMASGSTPMSIGVWFPMVHVAIALGLTYSTLAAFVNRSEARTIGGHQLRLTIGPLPWWGGNITLGRDQIRQLYVHENFHHDTDSGSTTRSYDLRAMLADGREKKLVRRLKERYEAAYLESALERALDMADARVPGEAA